jgi:glycosyltransferase involved in cell wall biosynthesis
MIKVNYISEISLPSHSGYTQHVLKICDAFSESYKTNLFLFKNNTRYKILQKNYLLKNKFNLVPFKKKNYNINFFLRLKYAFWVKNNIEKDSLILSRSILTSLVLSFWKINNILELHHPPTGLTKFIYNVSRIFKLDSFIKYIVISKNLKNFMKLKKSIVLDDAVDTYDYKTKQFKTINYEFTYIGSLFKGKGLEVIIYLSKNFPKNNFYVFGDLRTLNKDTFNINELKSIKNLFFKGYVDYKRVPNILLSSKFLLMPYQKKVYVNSKRLEVSNFMSPLKLFDYLASGKPLIASNLSVYSHILKNNQNCILVNNASLENWKKKIDYVLKNYNAIKKLSNNSKKISIKYTWLNRTKKIIDLYLR